MLLRVSLFNFKKHYSCSDHILQRLNGVSGDRGSRRESFHHFPKDFLSVVLITFLLRNASVLTFYLYVCSMCIRRAFLLRLGLMTLFVRFDYYHTTWYCIFIHALPFIRLFCCGCIRFHFFLRLWAILLRTTSMFGLL